MILIHIWKLQETIIVHAKTKKNVSFKVWNASFSYTYNNFYNENSLHNTKVGIVNEISIQMTTTNGMSRYQNDITISFLWWG